MKTFVLLFLVVLTVCQQLMQRGPTPGRYEKILFPRNFFELAPRIFNVWAFRAPATILWPSDLYDFCTADNITIFNDLPNIFGRNRPSNPCEQYFCSSNTPYYHQMPINESLSFEERSHAGNLHIYLHRWCVQCEQTSQERFDLKYERLGPSKCPHFVNISSVSECADNSTFIYYSAGHQACYLKDQNIFVNRDDFMHTFFIPSYMWGNSVVSLIGVIVSFFILTFLVTIPMCVHTAKKCRVNNALSNHPILDKIKLPFTFSNLLLLLFWMNLFQSFVAAILDITDIFRFIGRFRNISQGISVAILAVLLLLIFIQWFHISKLVTEGSEFTTVQKVMIGCAFITLFGWMFLGVLFYFMAGWVPPTNDFYHNRFIAEGVWLAISGILLAGSQIGIIIYGVIILKGALTIDLPSMTATQVARVILQIRLTKNLFIYGGCSLVSMFFIMYCSLTYLINPDILHVGTFFFVNIVQSIWVAFLFNILTIPFLDSKKLQETYCCCVKSKDPTDLNGNYHELRQK